MIVAETQIDSWEGLGSTLLQWGRDLIVAETYRHGGKRA